MKLWARLKCMWRLAGNWPSIEAELTSSRMIYLRSAELIIAASEQAARQQGQINDLARRVAAAEAQIADFNKSY